MYSGDASAAVRLATESSDLARSIDPGLMTAGSGATLAAVLVETDAPQRARDELATAAGGQDLPRIGVPTPRCWAYEILCRTEIALDRLEAADEWASRAGAVVQSGELPIQADLARRARASILLARGDALESARVALEAADGAKDLAPIEAAR